MQNFITIFHSVQEVGSFSLFQNLELGKPRPMINVISQSLEIDLVNINVYANVYQNIPNGLKGMDYFHFFRIWELVKASTNDTCHFKSLGLDLVNINVYAKVYQTILNGLRVMDIFHFLTGDKIFTNCPSQPSASVDFLRVVQSMNQRAATFLNVDIGKFI